MNILYTYINTLNNINFALAATLVGCFVGWAIWHADSVC